MTPTIPVPREALERWVKNMEYYTYLHWLKESINHGDRTYALLTSDFKNEGEKTLSEMRERLK